MIEESKFDFVNTFPPLGHSEHHFNKYPDHPWLKTKDEITNWLKEFAEDYYEKNFTVNDDLTVTISDDLRKFHLKKERKLLSKLPVQFMYVDLFQILSAGLETLVGTPYKCSSLYLPKNKISSFEGIGKVRNLSLYDNLIKSFKSMNSFYDGLDMTGNDIKSWDGFVGARSFTFWQRKFCENTSKSLLLETPDSIEFFMFFSDFQSEEIKRDKLGCLDLHWLNQERIKINNKVIDNTIWINSVANKKRKL